MAWRTAYASEIGTSHQAAGLPCQDANIVDEVGDCIIVAVADGAGSTRFGGDGAHKACMYAIQSIKAELADSGTTTDIRDVVRNAFEFARNGLEEHAGETGFDLREFGTTLVLAIVTPKISAFGQVGDGAAVYSVGDDIRLAHWPEQEALNVTAFLTSDTWGDALALTIVDEPVDSIALMTDGLSYLLLDFRNQTPYRPAIEKLFDACRYSSDPAGLNDELRLFLGSDSVNDRSDDDKTLVLAVRDSAE